MHQVGAPPLHSPIFFLSCHCFPYFHSLDLTASHVSSISYEVALDHYPSFWQLQGLHLLPLSVHIHILPSASPHLSDCFPPSSTGAYGSWKKTWENLTSLAVSSKKKKNQLELGVLLQQFSNSHKKLERKQCLWLLQEFQLLLMRGICRTCPHLQYKQQVSAAPVSWLSSFSPHLARTRRILQECRGLQKQAAHRRAQQVVLRPVMAGRWEDMPEKAESVPVSFLNSAFWLLLQRGRWAKCSFEMTQYNCSYTHSACRRKAT